MAELDTYDFEDRFAAAYRRYLDEAPTGVDASAVARAAAVQPRVRGTSLPWASRPWALRPMPAFAWLLLLGLLLAALGASAVFYVGQQRPALGFACPAGSTPNVPGAFGQARPPVSYGSPPMAYDSRAGKIVLVRVGDTWTFDVCTNTWALMHATDAVPVGPLVYDVDSDLTITIGAGYVWAYDLRADTWTQRGAAPFLGGGRLLYDPASAHVIVARVATMDLEVWTYAVATNAWTRIGRQVASVADQSPLVALDASVDKLVFYERGGGATRLFDLRTRAWSIGAMAPDLAFNWGASGGEIAYDEATKQTILSSYGRVIAYDAAVDRWEILVEGWTPGWSGTVSHGPALRSLHWTVYDPANQRLVIAGGQFMAANTPSSFVMTDDVMAFDPSTRAWITLLEPRSTEQPQ